MGDQIEANLQKKTSKLTKRNICCIALIDPPVPLAKVCSASFDSILHVCELREPSHLVPFLEEKLEYGNASRKGWYRLGGEGLMGSGGFLQTR